MQTTLMKLLCVLSMLLCVSVLHAQEKFWKQTSDADFLQGTFNRVGIPSGANDEVRLIHPILQAGADTLDPSLQKGMVYDEAGNGVRAWISSRIVYVQKFDAQRRALSDVIRVSANATAQDVEAALLDDGRFVVSWSESIDIISAPSSMPRLCQFFTASCAMAGDPVGVFSQSNGTNSAARPVADQERKRFLLLGTERRASNWYQTFGMFFSADGCKLSDSVAIIPTQTPISEFQMTGAFRNGRLALAWFKTEDGTGPYDIYYALADTNLVLKTSPVRVNEPIKGDNPRVSFDRAGNCLVTWMWMAGYLPGPPSVIYGRAYDTLGRALGPNVPLTHYTSGNSYWYELSFVKGMFRLESGQGFNNGQPEIPWTSSWNILTLNAGSFTSAVFDAGLAQTVYGRIFWEASVPPATRLTFQLRAAPSREAIASAAWSGPASGSDYYTLASGEAVNPLLNGNRFIQLKAFFEADTNGQSPILRSVSVSYASADTLRPLPVSGARASGEHRRVVLEWAKSPSADVKSYRIYRAVGMSAFDPESFVLLPAHASAYVDSTVAHDSLYRYGITAVDSAFNESPISMLEGVAPQTMKIFVASSGSMPEEGTSLRPFRTIGRGIELSSRGDTVMVLPGEYREDLTLKEGIALIGSGAAATKILSTNILGAITTAPHNLVKGFTIIAARGIAVKGSDLTVTENIFSQHEGTSGAGIYLTSFDRVVITKNIFLSQHLGLQATAFPKLANVPAVVRNNIFYGCYVGAQNSGGMAVFINNTFVVVGTGLRGLFTDTSPTTIMNNCFAGYPAPGTYMTGADIAYLKYITFEYNNQWNFNTIQRDTLPATNIKTDPLFVNFTKKDFHLGGGSLCRDAGNPSPEYRDKDGSRNDLGAYGGPDPMPEYMTMGLVTDCTFSNVSGFPGDTVAVDISLSNPVGMKQADIELVFDESVLAFHAARAGTIAQGFMVTSRRMGGGRYMLHLEGAAELATGSGAILSAALRILPSALPGVHSAVGSGVVRLLDGDGHPILIASVSGSVVTVKSRTTYAHRIHVDAGSSLPGDGSVLHPFATVQEGLAHAHDDDTVYVGGGVYLGPVSMKSNVHVKGAGAGVTTIMCPEESSLSMARVVEFKGVKNAGISGCTLLNRAAMGTVIEVDGSDADISMNRIDQSGASLNSVLVYGSAHVSIRDNYFTESTRGGMEMLTLIASEASIVRNVFSPVMTRDVLVLNNGVRATVRNNRFILSAAGMTAVTGRGSARSIVANNSVKGRPSIGSGMKFTDADSLEVVNNMIDVGQTGITVSGGHQEIVNNVFTGCAIALDADATVSHRYNLYWNDAITVKSGTADPNELTADPRVVDREKGDYMPAAGSPLIDGGDPSPHRRDNDGTRSDIGLFGGPYADRSMGTISAMRLRLGSAAGAPGDTVTIPVSAGGIIDMAGLQLMIEFDMERLELLKVTTAAATRSFSMIRKNVGQSIVSVEMSRSEPMMIDSASVALLVFVIRRDAQGSAFVNFQNASVVGGAAQPLSVARMENGRVDLTATSVGKETDQTPTVFSLWPNYPNPFNPHTTIAFTLPLRTHVTLKVYDILGRECATLVNGTLEHGTYRSVFNGDAFSSGIYLYRLQAGDFIHTRRMLLVK